MVTRPGAARILIPADRRAPRERLETRSPFFMAQPAQPDARPRLLSFESDSFLDDFLAVAGGTRSVPVLLPWRDWAEPPAALVDAAGAPRYAAAALARRTPLSGEFEASSGPALDADGIPHGVNATDRGRTPAWLRKLYLPLHERFNLIAFDLVCGAPGQPRVARDRIRASGAVIRRLAANPGAERWEDWIAVDDKHGAWLALLPAALDTATPAIDPAALPDPEAALEPRLRALFGLDATQPLPALALASPPLALLPPDAGEAAQHSTLYGYLPVFSAAREIPPQAIAGDDAVALAAALAARTGARLDTLFASLATTHTAARNALRALLDATVLRARPSAAQHNAASALVNDLVAGAPGLVVTDAARRVGAAVDLALREAISRLLGTATQPSTTDRDIAGDVLNADALWDESNADTAAKAPDLFASLAVPGSGPDAATISAWLQGAPPGGDGAWSARWDNLLRVRLHRLMDAWLAADPLPPPASGVAALIGPDDLATVVVLGLLRLRGCRVSIVAQINLALFGENRAAELKATAADGSFQLGLCALAETIEAVLTQESARDDIRTTPPWPQIAPPTDWIGAAHADGEALARAYAPFDDALAGAGKAALEELGARLVSVEARLDAAIGGFVPGLWLTRSGLRLDEQPTRGLLALPGLGGAAADAMSFRSAATARYGAQPERLALAEARAADTQPRLCFDADHLYAAWGWVRVAGHTPCEAECIVWTQRSEPFSIADPTDLLGARPASIRMPDIPRLLRDIPRIARARAKPFAGVAAPAGSGVRTGAEMADTRRDFGLGMICNFGIPVLTICALVLFNIIFSILVALPSFSWMLLLKVCLPFTRKEP